MQPSIFDQRYIRSASGLILRKLATDALMCEPDYIRDIEKLCDELAQAEQRASLGREVSDARKAHIQSLEREAECSQGTVRVLSRMISEVLDGNPLGAAGETPAPSDATADEARLAAPESSLAVPAEVTETPTSSAAGVCPEVNAKAGAAENQSARSSEVERLVHEEGAGSNPAARPAKYEFATGEGRTLYMNVSCSGEDAQTTARTLGLALGKHVIARAV